MADVPKHLMLAQNAAYWAEESRIKLQKDYWSFKGHQYLMEPMASTGKRYCFMKATQGGFTEMVVNKMLHGMIYKKYPAGVLYLFPTANDIGAFSQSRFGPLITSNPTQIGRFVFSTNSTYLKRVGDAFLFLRGGTLPRKMDFNTAEASSLRGITVDCIVLDEMDLMDAEVPEKARGRMGDSVVREEYYISNPTLPDIGIDAVFKTSDQRHWFRSCECGGKTCAELEFPDCVKIRSDGTGYIACVKCGKPVPTEPGEWVPAERQNDMAGYRWSQLSSTKHDPADILRVYNNPPMGNKGDVVRLRLGLPYVAAEERLRPYEVYACCGDDGMAYRHDGPCAMGVDCQKPKRYIIGGRLGRDNYGIFKIGQSTDATWNELVDQVMRFNVKSCVVDIRPYEDQARTFQKRLRRMGVICYLCEYSETTPMGSQFNAKSGICKVNRTEIMDATHRLVTTQGKLVLPRRNLPILKLFVKQVCATAKMLDTNRATKQSIYRYIKLGPDDFRHALNYFYLAASGHRIGAASVYRPNRLTYAINDRRPDDVMVRPGRRAYAIG